jgi:predicted GNAT superfamily acetyltransferase
MEPVALRSLSTAEDYAACLELQRETWGESFAEVVPGSILKICQQVGGVSAGAFAADGSNGSDGAMLGFVFGLTGVRRGRRVHWSHMLAVRPAARDLGLGTRLKLFQREQLLPLEVESVLWTFDPLEARNAHLNLNRLGAGVEAYVEDMYAGEMGSELARGIGTDRLIVDWRIASPRVERALAGEPPRGIRLFSEGDAPVINPHGEIGTRIAGELPDLARVRVEIPASIQTLKAAEPEAARAWRRGTRAALGGYLGRGYRVALFYREAESGRCFYGLER